jgi:hypothetical protein
MPRGLEYNDQNNQKLLPNAGGFDAQALIRSGCAPPPPAQPACVVISNPYNMRGDPEHWI